MKSQIKEYLLSFKSKLLNKETILYLFTNVRIRPTIINSNILNNLNKYHDVKFETNIKPSDIIILEDKTKHYLFVKDVTIKGYLFGYLNEYTGKNPPIEVIEPILLGPGDIDNLSKKITTTVGRFILNQIILVVPFKNKISYVNDSWKIRDIEKQVVKHLLDKTISPKDYYKFVDCTFYVGSNSELFSPTLTEKSLTIPQAILDRKKELLEQYKDQLDDPTIIAKIENELVAMDMVYLKNDPAMRFYAGAPKVLAARKKMFLIYGGIERFTDEDSGETDFISNSLSEGWNKDNFAIVANNTRSGSYSRGFEIKDSGTVSKLFARIFSSVEINKGDCGSKKGLQITITKDNYSHYIGRYIIENKKLILLTNDNIQTYYNKQIELRSPLYCQSVKYCSICTGELMQTLNQKSVISQSLNIGGRMSQASLEKMHSTGLKLTNINFEEYLV